MLVVLNSFIKNLFITKSSDLRVTSAVDRSKGSSPHNNIPSDILAIHCMRYMKFDIGYATTCFANIYENVSPRMLLVKVLLIKFVICFLFYHLMLNKKSFVIAVRRRTRDQKVAGSIPGRGAIKSTRSTQPSIPPG